MKAKILLASSIAFTMVSSSVQAISLDSFMKEQPVNTVEYQQLAMAEDIAPVIEPAYFGKKQPKSLDLRSSLPMQGSNQASGSIRKKPLERPWQEASLTDIDPMIMPIPGSNMRRNALLPREIALPSVRKISLSRSTLAPMAFVKFCKLNKSQCAMSGSSEIKLTAETLSTLKKVNYDVNRAILPRNESNDVWQANVAVGDCEDFALTKRAQLLELGFSGAALRLAVAKTSRGEGHAVLVVSTDHGDFVLDNRNDELKDYRQTDLTWVKIQGQKTALLWHEI